MSETRLTDEQVGALSGGYPKGFNTNEEDAVWWTKPDDATYWEVIDTLKALAKEVQSTRQRRCDGCGFWQTGAVAEGYGECGASTMQVFSDSVVTRGDFGCTQFTAKEGV
jgi:hypothetical protein